MNRQGPFVLTLNTLLTLQDPYASFGFSAAAAQIQNQSGFALDISGAVGLVPVQSFTAQTIQLPGSGAPITVLPTSVASAGPSADLYIVWLLPGERSAQPDGPLSVQTVDVSQVTAANVTVTNASLQISTNSAQPPVLALAAGSTVDINSGNVDIGTVAGGINLSGNGIPNIPVPNPAAAPTVVQGGTGSTVYFSSTIVTKHGETQQSAMSGGIKDVVAAGQQNQMTSSGVTVPDGYPGNLVYDSNLVHAIDIPSPTWKLVGASVGTANGDVNVLNPGTASAEWVQYGTGAAFATDTKMETQSISVVAGDVIFASSILDASNVTSGAIYLTITDAASGASLNYTGKAAGGKGLVGISYTVKSTDGNEVLIKLDNGFCTAAAGATIGWSQIQFTKTSTVQPYQPGPLWKTRFYKNTLIFGSYVPQGYLETDSFYYADSFPEVITSPASPPAYNNSGFALAKTATSSFQGIRQVDELAPADAFLSGLSIAVPVNVTNTLSVPILVFPGQIQNSGSAAGEILVYYRGNYMLPFTVVQPGQIVETNRSFVLQPNEYFQIAGSITAASYGFGYTILNK